MVTPARFKDATKGSVIPTAEVWASTDPAKKVKVKADGSYELEVANHPGTFQIFADYTGTDGNYKQSDPQKVETTDSTHSLNIALKYGYTTILSGFIGSNRRGDGSYKSGATVTIEVEGVVVDSTTSSGNGGRYSITVDHPGTYKATASLANYTNDVSTPARVTEEKRTVNFILG